MKKWQRLWPVTLIRASLAVVALCSTAGVARAQPAVEIEGLHLTGNAVVFGIAPGPDDTIWYTVMRCDDLNCTSRRAYEAIGRISHDGSITEFPLPFDAGDLGGGVFGIVEGPDGAMWFTRIRANLVGRMTPDGHVTTYNLPAPHAGPYSIAVGPDAALWFTEADAVGRITTAGEISRYPVPTVVRPDLMALIVGPDGAMWFAAPNGNSIGRMGLDGTLTRYALSPSCIPTGMAAGPDGAIWFTCFAGNAIGRLTLDGVVGLHGVPTAGSGPVGIVAGPDGAMWFTEQYGRRLGRITTEGVIAEYPTGLGSGLLVALAAASDGLWFGQESDLGHATIVEVAYRFQGFFLQSPALNGVAAGRRTAAVKFSLGGDFGLDVFAQGSPTSAEIPCEVAGAPPTGVEDVAVGGLFYKPETGRYEYAWKLDPAWRGTCRRLLLRLDDGSMHEARFFFPRE